MRSLLLLFLLYSCSQVSTKKSVPDDLVSIDTALDHIHSSYLKGCVDAYRDVKLPISFELCRDKAKHHVDEVKEIIDYVP